MAYDDWDREDLIRELQRRDGAGTEERIGAWSAAEMRSMLEDVVTVLDLSESAIEKHGPFGTAPANLVRLVLAEKDARIKALERGFLVVDQPGAPAQAGASGKEF